jgi:SAM-dependent methyltransferase
MSFIDVLISPENGGLNASAYLLANPDVAAAAVDPHAHFSAYGKREGRLQVNPILLNSASDYRRNKFALFAPLLDSSFKATEFPRSMDDSHFTMSDYRVESANGDFGSFVEEVIANPRNLYLDLGCGLRRQVQHNCLYLEVYPSISADIIVPPTCKYPIRANVFDGIVCSAVLEHVRKPWTVVDEIRRMLKPGGKVWIDWPFLQPVHGYPSHFFNATREGLRSIFEDAGFKCDDIGTWGHQGPDFTLSMVLGGLALSLPELMDMTVRDLLRHQPASEFWNKRWPALMIMCVQHSPAGTA